MPPFWAKNGQDDEDAGKAVEAKFTTLETNFNTKLEDLGKKIPTTESVTQSVMQAIKTENDRAKKEQEAREKQQRQQQENANYDPEKEFEKMAADPRAYFQEMSAPGTKVGLLALAKQARKDILENKEYYHGDFKKKVDELITGNPDLAVQANPNFIENCYNVVLGQHLDQIVKGDLKKKIAAQSLGNDGSGSGSQDDGKIKVEYRDPKSRYAAQAMGLTDEDFATAIKDEAIHGLEVGA
jgi:hypothetical protein